MGLKNLLWCCHNFFSFTEKILGAGSGTPQEPLRVFPTDHFQSLFTQRGVALIALFLTILPNLPFFAFGTPASSVSRLRLSFIFFSAKASRTTDHEIHSTSA
jgi:hypothetical protein